MANTEEEEAKTMTTSTDIRTAVETSKGADESDEELDEEQEDDAKSEAEDDSDKGGEGDGGEEEDDSDDSKKSEDEDDSKDDSKDDKADADKDSGYRYTQFVGDGKPETYISNLEKAYENSSAEGINLNQKLKQATNRVDAIVAAAKADPELAEKLTAVLSGTPSDAAPKGEAAPTTDPFLVDAKTKWEQQSTKEAEEFIAANPEVVSNPTIKADVQHWMEVFSREEYKTNGRLMTAGEAMKLAYNRLGLEDKREARKSLSDAKKAVAPTRPQGSRKPVSTASDFTDTQVDLAKKMGVSKEKLDKYAK